MPYDTPRLRLWRQREIKPLLQKALDHIGHHGCSIVSVGRSCDLCTPGFTYSTGIFDTCGGPEIITVGLDSSTAQWMINGAADLLRAGVDLTHGRHAGLLGDVDCEFRPVDPQWIACLMFRTTWYYEGDSFPVLQAIYPDLQNRFPQDAGFDHNFAQPLLQPGIAFGPHELAFWNEAQEPAHWPFDESPHAQAFVSRPVYDGTEPISYAVHDEDGDWQFMGESGKGEEPAAICLRHLFDRDPTLAELADLPRDWAAERHAPGQPWLRQQ